MKKAFYFILGIALVILTSATTVSVMTVKPQPPRMYMVKNFNGVWSSEKVGTYINQQMKEGWELKEVEGANQGEYDSTWIVVMVKY